MTRVLTAAGWLCPACRTRWQQCEGIALALGAPPSHPFLSSLLTHGLPEECECDTGHWWPLLATSQHVRNLAGE